MHSKLKIFIALLPFLGGCDNLPGSGITSTTRGMFLVSGVEPAVGVPGSVVTVIGSGFDKSLQVSAPSGELIAVSSMSATEFSFTIPLNAKGITEFTVAQGQGKVQVPFVASGSDTIPLLVGSGKGLCKQQQYFTLTGEVLNGEVNCAVSDVAEATLLELNSLGPCARDGQTVCITNLAFPSVDKSSLTYRVAPDKVVAGVLGEAASAKLCPK